MARSLRFEYPGALYHVINRGNYREWIFEDDGSKGAFLKCLWESCEEARWRLHAFCVMGNHFHLALETPEPNLSAGMQRLQSVFANRYNRFRNERGHLFQGRFKSLLVEDFHRLGQLCHYIHLNPVRGGICGVERLKDYPFSSYHYLGMPRKRPSYLDFSACLSEAGELTDTPAGRRKYEQYLRWLCSEEGARAAMFEKMSKGWAIGSKSFKKAVVEDEEQRLAKLDLGERDLREIRELLWERQLESCLEQLGKDSAEAADSPKSSPWKIAIAAKLKRSSLCQNPWLAERLNMGAYSTVSRLVAEMHSGKRQEAADLYKRLTTKKKG